MRAAPKFLQASTGRDPIGAPANAAHVLPPVPDVAESAGERMVFNVRSDNPRTPRKTYRVDLTANDGAGECACKDWGTRRGPAIRAGGLTLTRATTCKHVRRALAHFCRGLLRAMADSEKAHG